MNNLNHSRTLAARLFAAAVLLASAGSALAAVRYVDVNSTNATPPYTSWATAATNIQDAVDAAVAGDEIVVTNGIYDRVSVGKPLTLRSVNGPEVTTIHGGLPYQHRCVYLTNGANLSGFTLAGGYIRADGAGVFCESQTAVLSNCVLSGNTTYGGARGAGAYGGTLNNCTLRGNSALDTGLNCRTACSSGGGAFGSILNNCTLIGNYGGHGGGAASCILNNCTLADDSAYGGGGASDSALNNCALTGNSAIIGGGSYGGTLNNCIVYFNTAGQGANYDSSSTLNYSCTTPLPTNGVGNITNDPAFVNSAAGNYRLRADSPCIDAGTNLGAGITDDLDGRPRPLDGNGDGLAAFDIGAYEYRTPLLVWQDSPNPTPPHADWTSAARTIQEAVDAAVAGDEIVVTNGIYAIGGRFLTTLAYGLTRVAVDKPLTLRSLNGPQFTTIDGGQSNRCVYLTNGASLSGFTLTNGIATRGAGLWCESTNAVVSNCVLSGNHSFNDRNGSSAAGGAYGGTLNNCTLTGNSAAFGEGNGRAYGGGALGCTLNNCTLTGNSASDFGGGAYGGILNNCTLTGNSAAVGGGASFCTLNNCMLAGNSASSAGGGAISCTLNNCTLAGNSAVYDGGGAADCTLNNCTLTGNLVSDVAVEGDGSGGGATFCTLNNCIVHFNIAWNGANYYGANYDSSSTLNYSCTMPQPTHGVGNITNAPLFVDQASGNLRLQSNSPCINAGLNAFAPAGPDLEGNPRIVGYTVDMGAYESQLAPSIAPQLTITSSGTNLILAWATDYAGAFIQGDHYEAYFLYSTTNLVSPVVWRFVYPMPVVADGQLVVTNTIIDSTQRFYRIARETGWLGDVPCLLRGPSPGPCFGCFRSPIPGIWVWAQYANCGP